MSSTQMIVNIETPIQRSHLLLMIDAKDMAWSINKILNNENFTGYNAIFDNIINDYSIQKAMDYFYSISHDTNITNQNVKNLAFQYINEMCRLLYDYQLTPTLTSFV